VLQQTMPESLPVWFECASRLEQGARVEQGATVGTRYSTMFWQDIM
jgi:hypothetical protein